MYFTSVLYLKLCVFMLSSTLFSDICSTVTCLRVFCFDTILNIYKWSMPNISTTVGDRDKRFLYL